MIRPLADPSFEVVQVREARLPDPEQHAQAPDPELSVVIPVHDEAESIAALLEEVRIALADRSPFEVIVVDDGSRDSTPQVLAEVARAFPALRCLRHHERSGQSAALRNGVKAARAAWIVTLDGDGQNDPADIPALLAERGEGSGADNLRLITGRRYRRQDSGLKRLASRIANGVRRRLLQDATPDTGCGLKVFSREAFISLPHFDHSHRFLPALFLQVGGRVTSVDVTHRPRRAGRSHYGVFDRLWVGIVDMFGVMWLGRRAIGQVVGEKLTVDRPPVKPKKE